MAQDIVNENQNISYTNLDFSSIYPETLELIKKLTYKWDPSISDESDPGVILVKLSALLADKANYNIDKSVLEAFPLSVTQQEDARQLYAQLGYYMDWYVSATTNVAITWTDTSTLTSDVETYTIPKFTILTDNESKNNYAVIGTQDDNGLVVSDVKLTTDGNPSYIVAMEGTPTQFTFMNETVITPQMVDADNRLYLSTQYVSQNGIFIKNTGQENWADWKRVNNLYEQTYNELRYKFGFDNDSGLCYIELPDNYSELMGSGIEITYMIVDPDYADIPTQTLDRFLVDVVPTEDSSMSLGTTNVKITNYTASSGHKNIESINDAYENYKRVVGTFNTLITLRDYLNYILQKDMNLCSNAFVCDRTNDIQSSYKIIGKEHSIDTTNVQIEQVDTGKIQVIETEDTEVNPYKTYYTLTNGTYYEYQGSEFISGTTYYEMVPEYEDTMTPFSLKFYMLQNAVSLNSKTAYDETFVPMYDTPDMDTVLEDTSHLEHTYEHILPYGEHTYKKTEDTTLSETKSYFVKYGDIYNILNNYIYVKTTNTSWTDDNGIDITYYSYNAKTNVATVYKPTKLIKASKTPVDLGLYDRIDMASEDFNPSTSDPAIYEIDVEYLLPHTVMFRAKYPVSLSIQTYTYVEEKVQADILNNIINALYAGLSSTEVEFGKAMSETYIKQLVLDSDTRIKDVSVESLTYTIEAVYYNKDTEEFESVELPDSASDIAPSDYTQIDNLNAYLISKDIVCKSILAGTTQLLIPDDQFAYHLCQKYRQYIQNVYYITSEAIINIGNRPSAYTSSDHIQKTYTLKENEVLTLLRPSITDTKTYSSGIHYEYVLFTDVTANQVHQLKNGEYLFLYQTDTNDDGDTVGYTTYSYTEGTIIKPSFTITANGDDGINSLSNYAKNKLFTDLAASGSNSATSYTSNGTYILEIKNNSSIINNMISGTQTLAIEEVNEVTLSQSDGYTFYWVLNNANYSNNGTIKDYVLFDSYDPETQRKSNQTVNTYTLKTGESLFVIDSKGADLQIFGAGTSIRRNCGIQSDMQLIDKTPYEFISFDDVINSANGNYYFTIIGYNDITENTFVVSPKDNGMYEMVVDSDATYNLEGEYLTGGEIQGTAKFVLSTDEKLDESKTYYFLIMRDVSGYYKRVITTNGDGGNTISYEATEDTTTSIFTQVNLKQTTDDGYIDYNPAEKGWFEIVTESGVNVTDKYLLHDLDGDLVGYNPSDKYRYVNSTDTSVITTKVFSGDYADIDIDDISTYRDVDISEDTSPAALGLMSYYASDSPEAGLFSAINTTTSSDNVKVLGDTDNAVVIGQTATDVVWKTYLKKNTASDGTETYETITADSLTTNPSKEGWYNQDQTLTTDVVGYVPLHFRNSVSVNPFEEVNVGASENISGSGYFYRVLDDDSITYHYNSNLKVGEQPLDATYINKFTDTYAKAIQTSGSSAISDLLAYTDNVWTLTADKPSDWKFAQFKIATDVTVSATSQLTESSTVPASEAYVFFACDSGWATDTTIANCLSVASVIYPFYEGTSYGFIASYNNVKSSLDSTTLRQVYRKVAQTDNGSFFHTDEMLNWSYELIVNYIKEFEDSDIYSKIKIYFMPIYYKFKRLYAYVSKNYYTLDSFYETTFNEIPAWSCPSVDLELLAEDPTIAIQNSWQNVQDNTSITITQNDMWSLSEGDTITFDAQVLNVSSTDIYQINWPVFSNEEYVLDLDWYSATYKKGEDDPVELNKLTVPNCEWRGFSSLLINVSDNSGQQLLENHAIECYDEDHELIDTVYGEAGTTVTFQLATPISNKAGSNIGVSTLSTAGIPIANAVYVYQLLYSTDTYGYVSNTYNTYLYFNKPNVTYDIDSKTVDLPVMLPRGNYLIPLNGIDDVTLTGYYKTRLRVDETTDDNQSVTYYVGLSDRPVALTVTTDTSAVNDDVTEVEEEDNVDEEENRSISATLDDTSLNTADALFNYINGDIKFTGDKYRFMKLDVPEYIRVVAPEIVTEKLGLSPKDLGWYVGVYEQEEVDGITQPVRDENGNAILTGYELTNNANIGASLLLQGSDNFVDSVQPRYTRSENPDTYAFSLQADSTDTSASVSFPAKYGTQFSFIVRKYDITTADDGTITATQNGVDIPIGPFDDSGNPTYQYVTNTGVVCINEDSSDSHEWSTEVDFDGTEITITLNTTLTTEDAAYKIEEGVVSTYEYSLLEDTDNIDGYVAPVFFVNTNDTVLQSGDKKITLDNIVRFKMTTSDETSTDQVTFVLDDIFKYSNNIDLLGDEFENIAEKIKLLDPDEKYNYCYIPKDNDKIEDPLVPKSFWRTNHVCNPYTISKANFEVGTNGAEAIEYRFLT